MIKVNIANVLTIGLIAAVFVVAVNFGLKYAGVAYHV